MSSFLNNQENEEVVLNNELSATELAIIAGGYESTEASSDDCKTTSDTSIGGCPG